MAGTERAIGALKLFTVEQPDWTVEQVAAALRVSTSSAYRYVATLEDAGLLTSFATGRYTLGPAFIAYDRQIQLTDPLLIAARPVMAALLGQAPSGSTVLLCRLFRNAVLCVQEMAQADRHEGVAYERGRPMPLFRGATSKAILASMASRELRRLFATRDAEIRAAGLPTEWAAFRTAMARLRKAGHVISHAELDADHTGIAVPILHPGGRVLGSLSFVLRGNPGDAVAAQLAALLAGSAREIEAATGTAGTKLAASA